MKKQVTLTIDFERLTAPLACLPVLRPLITLRQRTPEVLPDGTLGMALHEQQTYWQVTVSRRSSLPFRSEVRGAQRRQKSCRPAHWGWTSLWPVSPWPCGTRKSWRQFNEFRELRMRRPVCPYWTK